MGARADEFRQRSADLVGISTDSVFSHKAWIETSPDHNGLGPIPYPLASDPGLVVCRRYSLFDEVASQAMRATVLVDPEGTVRWEVVHDAGIGRSVDEMLRVLEALQSGDRCPVNWQPGDSHV